MDPITDQLKPQVTIGYFGGTDPWISILETAWPDKFQPPVYIARASRREGYETLVDLFSDRRIVTDLDNPPALVCASDEIESELIESIGYSINWVRPVSGPGAVNDDQARACLNIPLAELETVLRTLALASRLRFPASLGVLGRRAGGEMALEDRELVALGLAVWYSYQRDEIIRHKIPRLDSPWRQRLETETLKHRPNDRPNDRPIPWEDNEDGVDDLLEIVKRIRNGD